MKRAYISIYPYLYYCKNIFSFKRISRYLRIFTNSEATDVTIPTNENHILVELPMPDPFAFTEFGST